MKMLQQDSLMPRAKPSTKIKLNGSSRSKLAKSWIKWGRLLAAECLYRTAWLWGKSGTAQSLRGEGRDRTGVSGSFDGAEVSSPQASSEVLGIAKWME